MTFSFSVKFMLILTRCFVLFLVLSKQHIEGVSARQQKGVHQVLEGEFKQLKSTIKVHDFLVCTSRNSRIYVDERKSDIYSWLLFA